MSPLSTLSTAWAGLNWGWKAAGAFLGGVATTLPLVLGLVREPIQVNAQMIDENSTKIEAVEESVDSMKADLRLVRCWALHEIQNIDPSECLFLNGGSR